MNLLEETQAFVVAKLSSDYMLSGACQFISENRKDLDYEIKNRLGRQGLVGIVMTPKATYAGKYEDLFLAWQLDELEVDVIENPPVNRGKPGGFMTGQDVAMRVFEVLNPLSGDQEGTFCPVSLEEGEDSGLIVNRCVMKALVYGERGDTPSADPPVGMKFMKLLDAPPEGVQPRDGWAWLSGDQFFCCAGEQVLPLGAAPSWVSSYVAGEISQKADLSSIPTKTSELTNDSGFVTASQVPTQSSIADADENRINADRSVSYIGYGTPFWQMVSRFQTIPKTIDLEGTKTDSLYVPTGVLLDGDVKAHLTYGADGWQIEIQTWDAGLYEWGESQFFYDAQSGESATELDFGTPSIGSCSWTAPRFVVNDNLVTESSLSSVIAGLEARIAALERA